MRPWLTSLLLTTLLAFCLGWQPQAAWAWSLPGLPAREQPAPAARTLDPSAPAGRLQEVAPPVAVQQLQQALAEHRPQLEIISPRDGTTLPDGPWQLKLKVRDWPLADAGVLGLGAHLVVQIDDQPPQRLSGEPVTGAGERTLLAQQEPLSPGSHRLTVYAARPWGEAVKSPGAVRQIRIHRLAANPQSLPAPGTPQLLPVSPAASNAGEPLLLDWLLLDAPLQNLREGDGSWRLKVTINGDSFLVDQAVPLWLRGWKSGRNSLQLELLDGVGEPLNPPFNSFVQAIELAAAADGTASKPRWQQGRLSSDELALLLAEQLPPPQPEADTSAVAINAVPEPEPEPPFQAEPDVEARAVPIEDLNHHPDTQALTASTAQPDIKLEPQPKPEQEPEQEPEPETDLEQEMEQGQDPEPALEQELEPDLELEPTTGAIAAPEVQAASPADAAIGLESALPDEPPIAAEPVDPAPSTINGDAEPSSEANTATTAEPTGEASSATSSAAAADSGPDYSPSPPVEPSPGVAPADIATMDETMSAPETRAEATAEPDAVGEPDAEPGPAAEAASEPVSEPVSEPELEPLIPEALPLQLAPPERITSSTPLQGSAREQVNPDGSLIQPRPQGPLAGLRQLLQRP